MLRQMLEAMGAGVRLAADGWDGMRYLSTAPDVVLCDLLMPVMDGFEFVASLRRSQWSRTPVVAITAAENDIHYLRTWAAGFDAHVTRRGEIDQPAAVIRAVLDQRGRWRPAG